MAFPCCSVQGRAIQFAEDSDDNSSGVPSRLSSLSGPSFAELAINGNTPDNLSHRPPEADPAAEGAHEMTPMDDSAVVHAPSSSTAAHGKSRGKATGRKSILSKFRSWGQSRRGQGEIGEGDNPAKGVNQGPSRSGMKPRMLLSCFAARPLSDERRGVV